MKTTADYLDDAKKKLCVESDYALAKWLEINTGILSGFRSGKRQLDNYTAARIANLLEISPLEIIATSEMEREKDSDRRRFWEQVRKRGVNSVLGITLLFSGLTVIHEIAEHKYNIHYALFVLLVLVAVGYLIQAHAKAKKQRI